MAVLAVPFALPWWTAPDWMVRTEHSRPASGGLASWRSLASEELDDLMVIVARGDHAAFADVYDRLAPAVFGVSRRVLRDSAQAEEVTQEVFVDLWRQAARYDSSRGSVRAWAVMIAHRRAVDRVRAEQAHRTRQQRTASVADAAEPTPEDTTLELEDRQRAAVALAALTDVQREALELAFYDGLTHVQIADQLGVALGTVKTRIRDGLLHLREVIGGAGG